MFADLVASVREGRTMARGETSACSFEITGADIKQLRGDFALSQLEFASLLGVSVRTLQNWEQNRRVPEGAARVLLQVAAKHPETVWDVIRPMRVAK